MNQIITKQDTWGYERHRPFFYVVRDIANLSMLTFFLCMAFLPAPEWAFSQETNEPVNEVRIVTGTGRIIGGNVAGARNRAISQAFSTAVEEYLVQRLGPQGMANSFQRLYEEIVARAKEQVQDYQIITEFTTDRYVRVLIKVRVNTMVLQTMLEDMGLRDRDTIQITALFMVSEKGNRSLASGWWTDPSAHTSLSLTELLLSRVFEGRGFRVVNRSFFPPEGSYDKGMLQLALTDEDAVKWGKLLSAQVVITGEATMSGESSASVYLKAIRVSDGTTIAQGFREGKPGSAQGEEQSAMEMAITEWVYDMIPYIVGAFKPVEGAVSQIIVTLVGLKSYKELHDIKDFLTTNFPAIKSVIERRLKREFVTVSIKLQGDSWGLAKKLLNHPKKPFLFDISEVSEQGFTVVRR